MKNSIKFVAGLTFALLLGSTAMRANQVTVQELAFDPGVKIANVSVTGFYSGNVYAGINHLLVDGVVMNGFCIDPFHFSSTTPLLYSVVPLYQAPKAPGTMNATQAAQIGKLWGEFYSPGMTTLSAAGMQIAIWKIVAGNQISIVGDDYGASTMIASLTAYTGASADLVGLTGPGQDYVVQRTSTLRVSDQGSTLVLLSLAVLALFASGVMQDKISRSMLGC